MMAAKAEDTPRAWSQQLVDFPRGERVDEALDALERSARRVLEIELQKDTPTAARLRVDGIDGSNWTGTKRERVIALAFAAYLLGAWELADDLYTAVKGEGGAFLNNRALLMKRRGKFVQEEAAYRRVLDMQPLHLSALTNLALCLVHQGRLDEAQETLETAERWAPSSLFTHLHWAAYQFAVQGDQAAWRRLERVNGSNFLPLERIEALEDLRLDPLFERARQDPRFADLLQALGAP